MCNQTANIAPYWQTVQSVAGSCGANVVTVFPCLSVFDSGRQTLLPVDLLRLGSPSGTVGNSLKYQCAYGERETWARALLFKLLTAVSRLLRGLAERIRKVIGDFAHQKPTLRQESLTVESRKLRDSCPPRLELHTAIDDFYRS